MISRILDRIGRYRKVILTALGCAIAGVVAFGLFYPEGTTYLKRVAEKPVFIYRTTGEQTCQTTALTARARDAINSETAGRTERLLFARE